VVTALVAVLPIFGAGLVWVPAAAYLLVEGHWEKALVLALWGSVVIGLIDNLLYPLLMKNRLAMHTVPVFIAAMGGLLDPKSSSLGKSKDAILKKLAFAPLPKEDTDKVPLGGMGLHISRYIPKEKQAEALNFIKWFQTPEAQKKWAQLGGVPARNDVLNSPDFLEAQPYNKVFTDSVTQLKDFWNLPEYAKLLNVHSTQVNAAISGTSGDPWNSARRAPSSR
jgi:ABC-type glycerol-3-phosphate transport system substrate-binding protein